MKKIINLICSGKPEFREQVFRVILLAGTAVSLVAIFEGFFMDNSGIMIVPLSILLIVMGISIVLVFKFKKINWASFLMGVVIVAFAFPFTFFISGGINSGAAIWYVLGFFYMFLMFRGKLLAFFLVFDVLVNIITYYLAYQHPEWIIEMDSRFAVYFDSLFAVVAVGLAVGFITKFQMLIYEKERALTLEQKKELEKASKAKDEFFANMSHELRTPINTIIGLNEMILRDHVSEEVAENAINIQNASKMLLSLVNDILDYSQMENNRMEIVPVQYKTKDFFGELMDLIRVRARQKNLDFIVDIDEKLPTALYGDDKRMKQIMVNLLTNAVKYTKEGSVTLSATVQELNDNKITLKMTVQDTGIGIKKENLDNLYDSFKRVDQEKNRKIEGSGLGLTIVKQLVDLMNGTITVDSIYTKGSVFTVVLEQEIVDAKPIGYVDLSCRRQSFGNYYKQLFEAPEARILVVDDNEMNLLVVKKLLSATKVQIDTAKSGKECLKFTLEKNYDVILLDHLMPEMDGLETLKEIRRQKNGLCLNVPIIALTANALSSYIKIYMDYGFDNYLTKPINSYLLEKELLKYIPQDLIEFLADEEKLSEQDSLRTAMPVRKRKRICITADSICDLPQDLLHKYDIRQTFHYIVTETGCFCDVKEIDADSVMKYLSNPNARAHSVSATVQDYEEFFAETLVEAEEVIHISLGKNIGSSYQHAVEASKGFGHVHVINSGQISCGMGILVLYAAKLAQEGKSAAEICGEIVNYRNRIDTAFLMPVSNVIYKNGLIRSFSDKICKMFNWHPIIKVKQSAIKPAAILTGRLNASYRKFVRYQLKRKKRINSDIIIITHTGCSVRQQELIIREIKKYVAFDQVIMQKTTATNTINAGVKAVGIAYVKK